MRYRQGGGRKWGVWFCSLSVWWPKKVAEGVRFLRPITMRNTILKSVTLLTLGAAIAASQSGCILLAAGAATGATVAYVRGDLETSLAAPPDKVAAASKAAFEELKLAVISNEATSLDAKVMARTAQDVKITVTAKGQSDNLSKVTVRVGTFGNSGMQTQVLEKIKAHLNDAAVAAMPTTKPSTPAIEPVKPVESPSAKTE